MTKPRCQGRAEYGHGLTLTVVHHGCCDRDGNPLHNQDAANPAPAESPTGASALVPTRHRAEGRRAGRAVLRQNGRKR